MTKAVSWRVAMSRQAPQSLVSRFLTVMRGLILVALAASSLAGCANSEQQHSPVPNQAEEEEHEPRAEQERHEAEARKAQEAREEAEANHVARKVLREEKAYDEGKPAPEYEHDTKALGH